MGDEGMEGGDGCLRFDDPVVSFEGAVVLGLGHVRLVTHAAR